ncbi:uncharacterized protein BDR25DRAFT_310491 [Lindgomyces ingoldianus]|uniref:Uncharacterized protein n=1 Tax=Lindgomyces ingoldianus TaxID=673940 RepID=A0ACB6RCQ1_9PLEO|nr:uncharacterized protein BDR25DRAFT_310491 [Lindgomyces ingoldianus]KAF2476105.1 hypothetical protein BDR25DRAFT_310491 [Lindgomyces ingoldianus]
MPEEDGFSGRGICCRQVFPRKGSKQDPQAAAGLALNKMLVVGAAIVDPSAPSASAKLAGPKCAIRPQMQPANKNTAGALGVLTRAVAESGDDLGGLSLLGAKAPTWCPRLPFLITTVTRWTMAPCLRQYDNLPPASRTSTPSNRALREPVLSAGEMVRATEARAG